ncbi:MAG: YihY/virulence factor BrkB family protein [Acidobacteria bacterium]|nr:YihY/virulence factor BrkB family protein [Acidobacteriota bacterium]
MRTRRFGSLVRVAAEACYRNGAIGFAKGAAYSALLSFFPVLAALAAILAQANAEMLSERIAQFLFEVVPPGTEELVEFSLTVRGRRPAALLVTAVLVAVWAASGVMLSLMDGFQAAYGVPNRRGFWRRRLVAGGYVFLAALPAVAASALIIFTERMATATMAWLGLIEGGAALQGAVMWVWRVSTYAISFATVAWLMWLLYKWGPDAGTGRKLWPGAWLATSGWLATTALFGWYVKTIANYNVLYGSIGAVIALIVWMYVLALVAIFGCEFNAAADRNGLGQERALKMSGE